MNKGITSIVAGLAMMGAVENTNAQDFASINTYTKKQTYEVFTQAQTDENTLKLEIKNNKPISPALKHLTTIGKTKDQREKITDPAELQKIYETQLAAYNATKQELRALKKQGKDIQELVKKMKEYNPAMIPQHIESINKDDLLAQKDDEIREEKIETKKGEENLKNIEENLKEQDINIKTMKNINNRLSKRKSDIYNPTAREELQNIIKVYDDIYGPGSFLNNKDLGEDNRKNLEDILNH